MSERTKTVLVKGPNGQRKINESDYDKKKHGAIIDPSKLKGDDAQAFDQVGGTLEGTGGQRIVNTEQPVALQPPLQPVPDGVQIIEGGHGAGEGENGAGGGAQDGEDDAKAGYTVGKIGKKHFVLDATGTNKIEDVEGIEKDGYAAEKDAWDAIMEVQNRNAANA